MGKRNLAKLLKGTAGVGEAHAPPIKAPKLSQQPNGRHAAGHLERNAERRRKAGRSQPDAYHDSQRSMQDVGAAPGLGEGLESAAVGDAYSALVGMLSAGTGHVSEALRRRRKEAEGQESESESGNDSQGAGGEAEGSGSEDERSLPGPGGKAGQSKVESSEGNRSKRRDLEVGSATGESHKGGESEQGKDMDEISEEEELAGVQFTDPSHAQDQPVPTAAAQQQPMAATLLPPPVDTWEQHVERVLTDAQVQELQGQSTRPKYVDVHHPDHQGVLPAHCHWQAAQREGLPPAPATLDAYSIKDRLQTRWRDVHGQDGKEQQEAAASAAAGRAAAGAAAAATGSDHQDDNGTVEEPGSSKGEGGGRKPRGKRPREQQQEQQERKEEEQRIAQGIGEASRGSGGAFVSGCQRSVFAAMHSYADVTMPCRTYPSSMQDPDPIMDAYLLHCLNHVSKTADRIKRNNTRSEASAKQQQANGEAGSASVEDLPRDQGFTRPKVLILLPQRNLAFKLVVRLVALAMKETRADSVQGKERFVEQFTDPEAEEENMDEGTRNRRKAKPADWRALFSGNTDDHFRLGIKITRGAIRLFADLFESDIIVASPLALATKLAEDKRRAAGKVDRGKYATAAAAKAAKAAGSRGEAGAGSDFLSSIEVLVMDRADVMAMQNWAHVETVMEALNQLPRQQHGVDIMRVREWQLSGWAKHYRQNILLSSFLSPEMNALVGGPLCANHAGRLKVRHEEQGVLSRVVPQVSIPAGLCLW